jgi:hypothetical protein
MNAGFFQYCDHIGNDCICYYMRGESALCDGRARSTIVRYVYGSEFQTILMSDSDPVCVYRFTTTFLLPPVPQASQAPPFRSDRTRVLSVPPDFPVIPTNISAAELGALANSYVGTLSADDESLLDTLSVLASALSVASPNFSGLSVSTPTLAWVAASAAAALDATVGNASAALPALGDGLVYSIAAPVGAVNGTGFPKFSVTAVGAGNTEIGVRDLTTPLVFTIAGATSSVNFTIECVYWNGSDWDDDGCTFTDGACACTHFTEFSARFRAIAATNADIFGDAARSAYSVSGFVKYASIYGALVGIFVALVVAFIWLMRLDAQALVVYQGAVEDIDEVCRALGLERPPPSIEQPAIGVPRHDAEDSWIRRVARTICDRILFQHTWLMLYFKYDPRLPRGFRLLFIVNIMFHTLFITTLLYGYTKSGSAMTIAESVVLSLITAALNIPFVKCLVAIMNYVGNTEYARRFPAYAAEYARRRAFEDALERVATADLQYALEKIKLGTDPTAAIMRTPRNRRVSIPVRSRERNDAANEIATQDVIANDHTQFALMLLLRNCGRRRVAITEDGLERAVTIAAQPRTSVESVAACGARLPTASVAGACAAAVQFAYVGWCLNYLLLFTASQSTEAAAAVATSFGISQATSILLSQPLTIVVTLLVLWIASRRRGVTGRHIGYFTDPQYARQSTTLSGTWAYYIFFYGAASASVQAGSPSVGIASTRAAVAGLDGDPAIPTNDRDVVVRDFYLHARKIHMRAVKSSTP